MIKNKFLFGIVIFSLITLTFGYSAPSELLSHASGNYTEDIFLTINDSFLKEDIFYTFDEQSGFPDIKYQGGFLLSALPGEERLYKLRIAVSGEVKDYSYLIDKKVPTEASIKYINSENPLNGFIFVNIEADARLFYGYDGSENKNINLWEGETLSRPENNILYYYTEDSSGNKSHFSVLYPYEKNEQNFQPVLKIKSPVEGLFANTQILFIDRSGFEWIKYSLNGSDPSKFGIEYTEPVEIRRYGNVFLRVSAKPLNSEKIIFKEIFYQVNTKATPKNIPKSGIYSGAVGIKGSFNNYRYCLEERNPEIIDPKFDGQVVINPVLSGVKYSTLRLVDFDDHEGSVFRYFYIIDDRLPAAPIIKTTDNGPVNTDVEIAIDGPDYSKIYYTLDGTTPGKSSLLYRGPIKLSFPENRETGSIIIKARSISLNNKSSEVVSKFITYDTLPPEKPDISLVKDPVTGSLSISYKNEDNAYIFYTSGNNNKTDNENLYKYMQPVEPENFIIDVPEGMDRDFSFIFAAKDKAGNWSEPSDIVSLKIDKKPPPEAEIIMVADTVHINSDFEVKYNYKIIKNGTLIDSGEGKYYEPLKIIEGLTPGDNLVLNAAATDNSGNTSLSSLTFTNEISRQNRGTIFIKDDKNLFSGSNVKFYAHPDNIDEHLIYYLTVLESDGKESTSGPFPTDGEIIVEGKDGEDVDYLLEVYSVNEKTSKKTSVVSYKFRIDNKKPSVPGIIGLPANNVSSAKVFLSPDSDEDSVVFLSYSETPEGLEPFSAKSIIFNKDTPFDANYHKERNFYLRLGAEDSAGNRSVNNEIFHFKVDKKPPELFIKKNDEPASIRITSNEPASFYYEYGPVGSFVQLPDLNSNSFEEILNIEDMNLADGPYIFKFTAVDLAGNINRVPRVCYLKIDKSPKETLDKPVVKFLNRLNKLAVVWKDIQAKIFYRLDYGKEDDDTQEFLQYEAPFTLKIPQDQDKITLKYYILYNSGEKSREHSISVDITLNKNKILTEGVTNGSFYNTDQKLVLTDKSALIRYEISTEGMHSPEVNVFSPQLTDELHFKIANGESIDFKVSLKAFSDNTDTTGGAEQEMRFSIDKQPPPPPKIQGVEDKEYYLSDRTVFFSASSDDIYYKVGISKDTSDDFIKYTEPFTIASAGGTYQNFFVSAYSEDRAGNRSTIKTWEITIDKEVIYVSNNGRDYSDGTRTQPFRTLEKAIEQVKNSERKTIFIAEGTYEISSTLVIDENISLYGGFKNDNWFDKDQKTRIVLNEKFINDKPAFYIYGGNLNISNISFSPTSDSFSSFFFINKGNLDINSCVIEADCTGTSNLILQNYGSLYINDSEISGTASSSPLIDVDYGNLKINNSLISADGNAEKTVIVRSNNSIDFEVTGSLIIPGEGKNIKALQISNSRGNLRNNTIHTGSGSISSSAVYAADSSLIMSYNKIVSESESRITTGIRSIDSSLTLNANKLDISARTGIIGLNITRGESLIYNNTVTSGICSDFSYLFRIDGGKHDVETNHITIQPAGDMLMLRNTDADVDFLNNTLIAVSGENSNTLFKPEGNSVTRIINNILINENTGTDSRILQLNDESMLSFKNNMLYGWTDYAGGSGITASDILSLDLIDGIYSAGRISGNIEENPSVTFKENDNYHLSPESRCIDSGYDLTDIINFRFDIDGDPRPNKDPGKRPLFDIGADEYYGD